MNVLGHCRVCDGPLHERANMVPHELYNQQADALIDAYKQIVRAEIQLRGAVDRADALERAIRAHRDALRAGTAITEADRLLHRSLDPALGGQ